ncbi:M3 family metallopeptidase, partial [Escherichia coli]|uniref:M3 family metallopeptidase n=1 Tax=Escherichia coli TaxID=562 RepID=UPI0025848D8F
LWDDVITLFHEFGHTLHGLFARQRYATLSGTNTPRDFVEFPSQINEHWATHPPVFARHARHYQSRPTMPDDLQQKLHNARLTNTAYVHASSTHLTTTKKKKEKKKKKTIKKK